MSVSITETEFQGAKFFNIKHSDKCQAVATVGQERVILTGFPEISGIVSLKFIKEIKIGVSVPKNKKLDVDARCHTHWDKIELFMKPDQFLELTSKANECFKR